MTVIPTSVVFKANDAYPFPMVWLSAFGPASPNVGADLVDTVEGQIVIAIFEPLAITEEKEGPLVNYQNWRDTVRDYCERYVVRFGGYWPCRYMILWDDPISSPDEYVCLD